MNIWGSKGCRLSYIVIVFSQEKLAGPTSFSFFKFCILSFCYRDQGWILAIAGSFRNATDNADSTADVTADATAETTADATADADATTYADASATATANATAETNANADATTNVTADATAKATADATADTTADATANATTNATATASAANETWIFRFFTTELTNICNVNNNPWINLSHVNNMTEMTYHMRNIYLLHPIIDSFPRISKWKIIILKPVFLAQAFGPSGY